MDAKLLRQHQTDSLLKASAPSSTDKPLIDNLPRPGKVSVNATARTNYVDGKNICVSQDFDRLVTVLANVSAPEGYGLDDRFNTVSDQFKRLSERCGRLTM